MPVRHLPFQSQPRRLTTHARQRIPSCKSSFSALSPPAHFTPHTHALFHPQPLYCILSSSPNAMLSKLGTKIALRKAGLGNVSLPSWPANDAKNTGARGGDGAEGTGGGLDIPNPFANVQWGKAFSSWQTPPPPPNPVAEPPTVGRRAPSNVKLKFPAIDGRPCVVLFLRYCGCPCELSPCAHRGYRIVLDLRLKNEMGNCS